VVAVFQFGEHEPGYVGGGRRPPGRAGQRGPLAVSAARVGSMSLSTRSGGASSLTGKQAPDRNRGRTPRSSPAPLHAARVAAVLLRYSIWWTIPIVIGIGMFLREGGLNWERTTKTDANHELVPEIR
jgi:hypothetical protein